MSGVAFGSLLLATPLKPGVSRRLNGSARLVSLAKLNESRTRSRGFPPRNLQSFATGSWRLTGPCGTASSSKTFRRASSMPSPTKHCGSTPPAKRSPFEAPGLVRFLAALPFASGRYSTHSRSFVRTSQAGLAAPLLTFQEGGPILVRARRTSPSCSRSRVW